MQSVLQFLGIQGCGPQDCAQGKFGFDDWQIEKVQEVKVFACQEEGALTGVDPVHTNSIDCAFRDSDVVGEGSYGCVYKGHGSGDGQDCAIKHVPKSNMFLSVTSLPGLCNQQSMHLKVMRQEAAVLERLDHPNIIKFVECFEDVNNFYMVLEFCSGGKVQEFIANQAHASFTESDAACVLHDVLTGVQYLHGKEMCHRNIRLDGIMLQNKNAIAGNKAKLVDCGYVCLCRPGQRLQDRVGSPLYMSPEMVERSYDKQTDIWSCGVTAFHILSGDLPFNVAVADDLLKHDVKRGPLFKAATWTDMTQGAKDVIRGMMIKTDRDRWQADEVLCHQWVQNRAPGSSVRNLMAGKTLIRRL